MSYKFKDVDIKNYTYYFFMTFSIFIILIFLIQKISHPKYSHPLFGICDNQGFEICKN